MKLDHHKYVTKNLMSLPGGMMSQDGGQPWFLFWMSHTLEVLGLPNKALDDDVKARFVEYLR